MRVGRSPANLSKRPRISSSAFASCDAVGGAVTNRTSARRDEVDAIVDDQRESDAHAFLRRDGLEFVRITTKQYTCPDFAAGYRPKSLWQSRRRTPAFLRPSACFGVALVLAPVFVAVVVGAMNSIEARDESNSMFSGGTPSRS